MSAEKLYIMPQQSSRKCMFQLGEKYWDKVLIKFCIPIKSVGLIKIDSNYSYRKSM
jgi:hypothetical protein